MFIDTHAHLYASEFDADRMEMIHRAEDAGVGRIYLPNVDVTTIDALSTVHQMAPALLFPLMGLHPCSVKPDYIDQLKRIESALSNGNYYGIGEIGIDLYWDPASLPDQKDAFKIQCQWAHDLNLPVIIHSRDAVEVVIELIEKMQQRPLKGVFHCFGGNLDQARRIEALGEYYFGLGGVITFKNSGLGEMVSSLPLEKVVLETDAPYLAPAPFRGKRNESAYLVPIAKKLAALRGVSLEIIEDQTTINALNLYSKNGASRAHHSGQKMNPH